MTQVTRTTRFQVRLVCRKKDSSKLHKKLWQASDDLRASLNRSMIHLIALKSGAVPWPEEPGKRGKHKGVMRKVPEQTLCYRLVTGNWSPGKTQPCYQPKVPTSALGSSALLLASGTLHTRIKTDWTEIQRGQKSAPTFKSAPLGTAQGKIAKFHEDGRIDIPIWPGRNEEGKRQSTTITVRPVRLDGSTSSIIKKIRTGDYKPGSVFLTWKKPLNRTGKWFVCVQWTGPVQATEDLDPEKILGVDIGLDHAAACIDYEPQAKKPWGKAVLIPHPEQIMRVLRRRQRELRQRRMHPVNQVGKGRKQATRGYAVAEDQISRVVQTAFEQIASDIVKVAVKRRCGVIAIEDHKNWSVRKALEAGEDQTAMWRAHYRRSYYRWHQGLLRKLIADAAPKKGIKVVVVNPAYSSLTCSSCGTVWPNSKAPLSKSSKKTRNRKAKQSLAPGAGIVPTPGGTGPSKWGRVEARKFLCSCGYKEHADVNAGRNLAMWSKDPSKVVS